MPRLDPGRMAPINREYLIRAKCAIREGVHRDSNHPLHRELHFKSFANEKNRKRGQPEPLPDPSLGHEYVECDAGLTRDGGRGCERFVFEAHARANSFQRIYFTDDHYAKFSFYVIEI